MDDVAPRKGKRIMLHTGLDEIAGYVFVPGSVERAALISKHFDEPQLILQRKAFLAYSGKLEGEPVAVISTGIGGPTATICADELHRLGVHTMLRIGSCASCSAASRIGDVMIPKGAVRMEGTSDYYVPKDFPAVPDYELFRACEKAAIKCGYPYNTGITITKDSFYTETSPETKPISRDLVYMWGVYERSGAASTSMECAPLFIQGAVLGFRTAAVEICATNYNDYSNDNKNYPRGWEQRAIEVGIEAMRIIIRRDREQEKKGEKR